MDREVSGPAGAVLLGGACSAAAAVSWMLGGLAAWAIIVPMVLGFAIGAVWLLASRAPGTSTDRDRDRDGDDRGPAAGGFAPGDAKGVFPSWTDPTERRGR